MAHADGRLLEGCAEAALALQERMLRPRALGIQQHSGDLVGHCHTEESLVGLPGASLADMLEAEDTDDLTVETDGNIEHGADAQRDEIALGQPGRAGGSRTSPSPAM